MSFCSFHSGVFSCLVFLPLTAITLSAQTVPEVIAVGAKEKAHKYEIRAMMTTPDGGTLITVGHKDKTIKLWSLPGGKLTGKLQDQDEVTAIAVTPDGKTLASANFKGITLWSLADRKQLKSFGNKEYVSKLKISPDGKNLVALEEGDAQNPDLLRVYSLPFGENVGTVSPTSPDNSVMRSFQEFAFVAEGTKIAADESSFLLKPPVMEPRHAVGVWGLDGQLVRVIVRAPSCRSLAASRDGKYLAVSCTKGEGKDAPETVRIWSMPEGEELAELDAAAEDIEFSADGRVAAISCLRPSSVLLWSAEKRTVLGSLDSPGYLHAMTMSPDGQFVATGYDYVGGRNSDPKKQKIVLWSAAERRPVAVLLGGYTGHPSFLVFTPDSRILIAGQESYAKNWSVKNVGGGQVALDMRLAGNEGIIALWTTNPPQFQAYLSD